jgi:hypothetical protein
MPTLPSVIVSANGGGKQWKKVAWRTLSDSQAKECSSNDRSAHEVPKEDQFVTKKKKEV